MKNIIEAAWENRSLLQDEKTQDQGAPRRHRDC